MPTCASQEPFNIVSGQNNPMFQRTSRNPAGDFCPTDSWAPSINIYQLEDRIEVCVDLAGMDRKEIDLQAVPGRLVIRGVRPSPEPKDRQSKPMQIVAMEIDHGSFCRDISIPENADIDNITGEYREGMLWISLPLIKSK